MGNLFNLIKNNKGTALKIGLGLVGTAIGLAVGGCFTENESVIIEDNPDGSMTIRDAEPETTEEVEEG